MSEKRYVVRLNPEERGELAALVKTGKVAAYRRSHAQILLEVDQGEDGPAAPDSEVAEAVGVHSNTVEAVRVRFVEQGLEAALGRKKQVRPSRIRKLDGRAEARLLAVACGAPPKGRSAWTVRLPADKVVELGICEEVSHTTIWRTPRETR